MNYKNINADELNYIIYCRKSSDSEDRQVQSLETQIRELQEHAKKNGLNIVKVIQESKSAFKVGRLGFDEMVKLVSTGKANALLVIRANRISRNAMDAGHIIDLMDTKKLLYIRCPSSTCYTTSSTDKMMIALELIFSKKDSDDKSDMVKEGIKSKAIKGIPNGQAILGYKNNMSGEKGNRTWDNDIEKQILLKKLYTEFLTGNYSVNKIAKYAREVLKLTTTKHRKIGGGLVTASYIAELLKNPIPAGFFYYDGIRHELDSNLNRIITEDEYTRIQVMTSNKNAPRSSRHEGLYTGIIKSEAGEFIGLDVKHQLICDCKYKFAYRNKIRCPNCNTDIVKINSPKYLEYRYYYNVAKKDRSEKTKAVNESSITEIVMKEIIEPLSLTPELATWSKKYLSELKDKDLMLDKDLKQIKENTHSEAEKEKSRVRSLLITGVFNEDEYKKEILRIESKEIKVEVSPKSDKWEEKLKNVIDIGIEGKKVFESNGQINAKRSIIMKSTSNLIWNENKAYVIKPIWLCKYIEGVNRVKSEIIDFEPKNYTVNKGLNEKTSEFSPAFSSLLRE